MDSTFEQAAIPVEREKEFSALKSAIERVFAPPQLGRYLRSLQKQDIGVRSFDRVLDAGLIERADKTLAAERQLAKNLYRSLSLSDQGLIREFYLERLEQVDAAWRAKYAKVYRVV
jgi:hypothetical protein